MTDTQKNPPKTLLGLDYGIKKMGMALGNSLLNTARPFDILAMNNGQPDWDNLIGIIESWQINIIVVGLPLNMDGTDSMLSKRASKFARRLAHRLTERRLDAQVFLSDERLTSHAARHLAWELGLIKNQKDPIDDISACLILNDFFENPELAKPVMGYIRGQNDE